MNNEVFEIVQLVLQIALIIITAFIVPAIRKYLNSKTTKEQREEFMYWTNLAIKIAEDIYKERGQGKIKKEYVLEYLNNLNNKTLKLNNEQISSLIDMIVAEFNKNGWDKELSYE